jgi:hypothetical protein
MPRCCVYFTPERREEIVEQREWAFVRLEQVKKRALGPEVVKMQALINRCDTELEEMDLMEDYQHYVSSKINTLDRQEDLLVRARSSTWEPCPRAPVAVPTGSQVTPAISALVPRLPPCQPIHHLSRSKRGEVSRTFCHHIPLAVRHILLPVLYSGSR